MKVFWIRFALWVSFSLVAPIVFICVKYKVFTSNDEAYRITGWGLLAIIILAISFFSIIKEVMRSLPRGSMIRQCISGYSKILPILIIAMLMGAIKEFAESFEHTLVFIFIFEAIAVPINPLPKWAEEHGVNMMENTIFNAIKRAMKKDDE